MYIVHILNLRAERLIRPEDLLFCHDLVAVIVVSCYVFRVFFEVLLHP